MNKEKLLRLKEQCYQMKLKALEMAYGTGNNGSHIGGAFSSMEIFAVLYEMANVNDMMSTQRDRIIVSKGHCVLSYYTALWQKGMITEEELTTFDKNGTEFHGHPHRNLDKGMEFSSGSLGLGLSYAVGVALSCKRKSFSNRIYVILGDGECNEGIIWESLMSIKNFQLNNITIIVDRNGFQLDGPTIEVMNHFSLEDKFESFGLKVKTINGHSIEELYDELTNVDASSNVLIADTIKANGISFLENNKFAHQTALTQKKYLQALDEIKNAYGKL
ncbi:MAG: 1-deoxy-D-xylulose-5-phosphate synthase N-terminal domain-containing protein [Clostridia bacterium]|nr:1-deoxy-D-xylulose-5-phosphate synthase N-terminal domain-containing protein [Clostridia bacterium]